MLWFTKQMFTALLASIGNASNHTKCIPLNNQQSINQPSFFVNVYPNEYCQGLHYSPSAIILDICMGSCNTLNDLSNRLYVSKNRKRKEKQKDLKLYVFKMNTGINESKTLKKHVSCKCECKRDG